MTTNHKFWLVVLALGLGLPRPAAQAQDADRAAVHRLDSDSLRAFLACDVACYRQILAGDFRCVLADGRLIDKAEFLRQAAQPPAVVGFRREEPEIRLYGDTAVVTGRIAYRRPDGAAAQTRYVDFCVRRDGRWQIVSAQYTRVSR